MKTFVRCGTLFTGAEDEPRRGEVLEPIAERQRKASFRTPRKSRRKIPPADIDKNSLHANIIIATGGSRTRTQFGKVRKGERKIDKLMIDQRDAHLQPVCH